MLGKEFMKKEKQIKRMLIGSAVLVSVLVFNVEAYAQEEPGIEKFASEDSIAVEDTYWPRLRGSLMYHGYVKLTENNGKADVYGETLSYRDADEVGLDIYLDKYNGTSYGTYTYWKTVEKNNHMNMKSYTVSVPKGYYYRLHGYHYVSDGSDFENGETITQGLKIPQ